MAFDTADTSAADPLKGCRAKLGVLGPGSIVTKHSMYNKFQSRSNGNSNGGVPCIHRVAGTGFTCLKSDALLVLHYVGLTLT